MLITGVTEYKNSDDNNAQSIEVGDVVKVDVVFFEFLLEKDNEVYSAHTIHYVSD